MNYFYNFNLKVPGSLGFAAIAALALGTIGGCNNDSDRNWDPVDPNAGIYPVPQTINPFVGESPRKIQFWDLTYSWVEDPDGGTGTCTAGNVQILGDEPQVTQTADTCPESLGQVAPCDPQAGDDDQGNNVVASGAVQQSVNGCFKDEQGVANCSATLVSGPTDELTCQQAVEREDPLGAGAIWYQRVADSGPGTSENNWWGKAPGAPGGEVSVSGGTQLSFGGSSGAAISSSAADSETAISVALSGGREFSEQAQPIYLCNSPTADVTSTDACALSSLFGSCLNDGQNCKIDNITGDTDGVFNVYLKSPPVGAEPPVIPFGVIFYLGQGYNQYTANPYPTSGSSTGAGWSDPGWSGASVFLADESTGGPVTSYTTVDESDASLQTTNQAIESSSAWTDKNTSSFSVKGGVPDVGSSTAGASFSSAAGQLDGGEYVYYSNEYYQQMQTSTISPLEAPMPLSANFIAAVNALPPSYSTASDNSLAYQAYETLLSDFGTAVAVEIAAGGRWVETFTFTGQAYVQAQSSSSSFNAGISAMDDGIKGSGSASDATSSSSGNSLAGYVSTASLTLLGGTPGIFTEWVASITALTNLYPIDFTVVKLSNLAPFLAEPAVNTNFCPEGPSCYDAISLALEGYGDWLAANACSEDSTAIYPGCTPNPSTVGPTPYVEPPVATPVEAADTKRSFSINFSPAYDSAISHCVVTALQIDDGDETDGGDCGYSDGVPFGPYGTTRDCYLAMQSDNVGVYGSAVFQCYYTNPENEANEVTFSWNLAEDLPESIWWASSPVNAIEINLVDCDDGKKCNLTGSIVVVPD